MLPLCGRTSNKKLLSHFVGEGMEPFQICTCLHFIVSYPKKYDAGIEWD